MPKDEERTPAQTGTREPRTMAERTWAPFWDLRREIEDLFDDFHAGSAFAPARRRPWRPAGAMAESGTMPSLDVVDKDDAVKIVAELPGVAEDDIDVEVTDDTLTISGEKREKKEEGEKEGAYYMCERRFGAFRRSVRLPEGIDKEAIEASAKDGVLTVHLPKTEQARKAARKIEVKSGT
ncbi:Hsp20/alpha crystallin family protein [Roseovarius salinarum]|uniref:Hsp20/alpha crystallin family protein n=1 Tax=Roseovarius salinarum TaxID=1981892 RepID=UPI0013000E17|nr:Hsp20/alpha crystallin family protein [Roseovarius salinarum]